MMVVLSTHRGRSVRDRVAKRETAKLLSHASKPRFGGKYTAGRMLSTRIDSDTISAHIKRRFDRSPRSRGCRGCQGLRPFDRLLSNCFDTCIIISSTFVKHTMRLPAATLLLSLVLGTVGAAPTTDTPQHPFTHRQTIRQAGKPRISSYRLIEN